jgi:hypothetical protein
VQQLVARIHCAQRLWYPDTGEIVPQLVGQISDSGLPLAVAEIRWGHNIVLVEQIKNVRAAVANGWRRS